MRDGYSAHRPGVGQLGVLVLHLDRVRVHEHLVACERKVACVTGVRRGECRAVAAVVLW